VLNHPNVVGVFDTGTDGERRYVVMEYIGGRTTASRFVHVGAHR
jgi:hypothetical protein